MEAVAHEGVWTEPIHLDHQHPECGHRGVISETDGQGHERLTCCVCGAQRIYATE